MTTATTAPANEVPVQVENARQPALPFRGDTLLGVCEAIGQDLGFNPTWLRVAFASLLLWNPEVIVIAYLALGVIVAVTRLVFPDRRSAALAHEEAVTAMEADTTLEVCNEREEELLAA